MMIDEATGILEISLNGTSRQVREGETLESLISDMKLNPQLVAVEINRSLVRRGSFRERELMAGDHIEIVEFVGGG